jgi:hypothetical protein
MAEWLPWPGQKPMAFLGETTAGSGLMTENEKMINVHGRYWHEILTPMFGFTE